MPSHHDKAALGREQTGGFRTCMPEMQTLMQAERFDPNGPNNAVRERGNYARKRSFASGWLGRRSVLFYREHAIQSANDDTEFRGQGFDRALNHGFVHPIRSVGVKAH